MDLNDPTQTRVIKDHAADRIGVDGEPETPDAEPVHELDSEPAKDQQKKLLEMYRQELERQGDNRFQMAVDEDYKDNIQWDEDDANVVKGRGQAPLVYNVISTSLRWVFGTEKRSRIDFKVLPRRKEESKQAEKKTAILKYLSDVNRTPFSRSRAFQDGVTVGLGWLETGIQDEDDSEPIYTRYESWRNVLWDSASTSNDLADCRYIFRPRWLDVDVACALFPDRAEQIKAAAVQGDQFGGIDSLDGDEAMDFAEYDRDTYGVHRVFSTHKRERVRLIECWYKKPVRAKRVMQGPWKGQIYDESEPRHQEFAESLAERLTFKMCCAIMTTNDLLWMGDSPYRHNRFPFIPVWGYRRGRDGLPYGMVRGLRDIQDDINKRAAKIQYLMASEKVIMDEGAVEDVDAFRDEFPHPDAVIEKRPGKDIDVLTAQKGQEIQQQREMFSLGIQMIQQVGGVTDELLARKSNATSGIAIERRQEQGSLTTAEFFDNLRFADQLRGELELSLVEQFMTEPKQFRITNMRGNADFVELNTGLPEDDITRTKSDFVISEEDWRASVRQGQVESLFALMQPLAAVSPQVVLSMLDLLVDSMDLHVRDELVKRIRQITGMRDPDASEPSPEEIQAAEQQAAQAAEQKAQQDAIFNANLRKMTAEAADKEASADQKRTNTMQARIGAQNSAIETARSAALTPGMVPIADHILSESGWQQPQSPAAAGINP